MRLLIKNNTVIGSLPDHPSGADTLCVKGRFGITELVNHPTRLKQPQKVAGQNRLGIAWDDAVQLAAEKLTTCPPERFEMIVSSNCTNEDLYIAQKFTRQVMQSGRIHTVDQDGYADADRMDAVIKLLAQSQPLSILSEAQAILCLGLDDKYSQSVVEVKLHQAKARGARIITLSTLEPRECTARVPVHSQEYSLSYYADEWLQPLPGKEPDLIHKLLELAGQPSTVNPGRSGERPVDRIEQAARFLKESSNITVIVGPSFLDHADSPRLLEAVDRLVKQLGARLIVLPEQGNLLGSLLLGISPRESTAGSQDLEVLYLVGENVPVSFPGHPFVLYQNIYPPSPGCQADLLLPAAAFSEEEGTFINHAGRLQEIHRGVPPVGAALPTWEILCRIAQKMGAQGFDYAGAADIRAEIAGIIEGFQAGGVVDLLILLNADRSVQNNIKMAGAGEVDACSLLTRQTNSHTYMGFPLAQWVAGLRQLPSQFRGLPSQFRGLYPDDSRQEHV
jgi:predicted molibdopterin-dependent oxidoreductase YjgC